MPSFKMHVQDWKGDADGEVVIRDVISREMAVAHWNAYHKQKGQGITKVEELNDEV